MAQQQGSNAKLLLVTEKVFKTTPSNPCPAVYIPFVSESLRLNRNLISSSTIRSTRNPSKPVRGQYEVAGDIVVELAPQHGALLRHTFGTYTAVSGGSMYTHTYKIGALPSGLCIEKQFPDLSTPQFYRYNGCKINSWRLSAKSEGFIECTFNIMGAKETGAASSMQSSPTDLGFSPWDGFGATIRESGTTLGVATSLEFTMENGLDGNTYVLDGTGERYSMPAGIVKVSGTATCLFDSAALYTKAVNNTETSLEIELKSGDGTGTAGNEKLTITFDEIIFKPQAPVVSGPSGVMLELPFEAYYDNGAQTSAIRAVLLSPTLSYTDG